MQQQRTLWSGAVPISYGLLIVCDSTAVDIGLAWNEACSRQGFARQESCTNLACLIQYGDAECRVLLGSPTPADSYGRLLSVPFVANSDTILIGGVEEADQAVGMAPGAYRLYAGQSVLDDLTVRCDLWFAPATPGDSASHIHTRDQELTAQEPLIEWADAADAVP